MSSLPDPGTGYFVPSDQAGSAVLVLPSAWGLTPAVKALCNELGDCGYHVLAPDLNDGFVASSSAEAGEHLRVADMNVTASLVQSSLRLLSRTAVAPSAVGVVGFGSGASWALWLSERLAGSVAAVVAYHGTQSIEFAETTAQYLLHLGTHDSVVTDDDVALLGLNLKLSGRYLRVERHEGADHDFAEPAAPTFSATASAVAWRQTLEFLAAVLPGEEPESPAE